MDMKAKEEAFWALVQETAEARGCSFFLDCGEGRDFETDTMAGEDLSGWLIPREKEELFSKEFSRGKQYVSDDWNEYIYFAIWTITDGAVSIRFECF